ncbi:methylthioribulose 1-phosphate dehydratase [Gottfriedia acidiceleris]|uniref:methylthioribulose 1-phosphate dehydratase n=1 Tax=Gottfriedia acidiceleris TaxID=371036 RepID=UPI000B44FFAB|nr:methylthioribulose 1-phosphate dehydratase [Gottfriedia acidiceleris]
MKDFFKHYDEIREVKKVLADRDWFLGTSGNLSIKVNDEPLNFLVTTSGKDKTKHTYDDFLLVNEFDQSVWDESKKPSAEAILHRLIYQHTNAKCVLHVHTLANNFITKDFPYEDELSFSGIEIIKALGLWEEDAEITIPIIKNHAHIPTLANEFLPHIKNDHGAVLIHNHGITVWAESAFEAKKHLEAYEFLFQYALQSIPKNLFIKN